MITIKTAHQIEKMRVACRLTKEALELIEKNIRPGISTAELDRIAFNFIKSEKARPNFLHYDGFPASICASVNDVVIHGIPSKDIILREGDIISIDMGVEKDGYNGDAARTFAIGNISPEAQKLIDVTRESFFKGVKYLKHGAKLGNVSHAIQEYVENNGFSVVETLSGMA